VEKIKILVGVQNKFWTPNGAGVQDLSWKKDLDRVSAEIARRKAARAEFGARCRTVFEKLRPQLIKQYYNWFIAVDPDCEKYLIDPSLEGLVEKIRARYQDGIVKLTTYRLNETGVCGRI